MTNAAVDMATVPGADVVTAGGISSIADEVGTLAISGVNSKTGTKAAESVEATV